MKRATETMERDLAALIKRSHDLHDESAELNRTAEELAKKAACLREDLSKQKRGPR